MPEVTDDVWIDFADNAYMKWVLALPDLTGDRVRIRVTPTGPARVDDLKIVDVAKKPMGLTADLKTNEDFAKNAESRKSLMDCGFAIVPLEGKRQIFSNQGEVRVVMKTGSSPNGSTSASSRRTTATAGLTACWRRLRAPGGPSWTSST
mgnify:CR=1 FL=1